MMPEPERLAPDTAVPGRPFADPAHTRADFAALNDMCAVLRAMLVGAAQEPRPGEVCFPHDPDGRGHRVVLLDPEALLAAPSCVVVGFFGQRRPGADLQSMEQLDGELTAELRAHPFMLSYSSRQLPSGNWANLVLLADPDGARRWRESQRHSYAARQIAPSYYATIRLHNGLLPAGLASNAILHVRTSYYDFSSEPHWLGVRQADQQTRA